MRNSKGGPTSNHCSSITIKLPNACVSQLARLLCPAVLEKSPNHHSPLLCFWLFYAETFKKMCQGGGKVIELDHLNVCKGP